MASGTAAPALGPARRLFPDPPTTPPNHFNTKTNGGVTYFEVNQKGGGRGNSAKAFLPPRCYGRPHFEMWTSALATRLIIDRQPDGSKRCTGVQVWDGREMVT